MKHAINSFLDEKTLCGKPVEYKHRAGSQYENDHVMTNVALEVDDITCPDCLEKAVMSHAKSA